MTDLLIIYVNINCDIQNMRLISGKFWAKKIFIDDQSLIIKSDDDKIGHKLKNLVLKHIQHMKCHVR